MTITQPETRIDLVDRGIRIEESSDQDPVQADPPAPARPQFTITDAAASCAVSRKTITRKLADLAEHGAAKDADGVWRIPVEALLAVGLHPGRSLATSVRPSAGARSTTPPPAAGSAVAATTEREMVTIPRDRWDDVRIRLARAEAEASERALALADARLALRALTAAPHAPEPSDPRGTRLSPPASDPSVGASSPGSSVPTVDAGTPLAASSTPDPDAPAPLMHTPPAGVASGGSMSVPADDPAVLVATARTAAAQRGGYVPPAGAPVRKRRWWQSK